MAAKFQFAFLLDLAIGKREDAARMISSAADYLGQARERLTQIEQYREEYRNRLTRVGAQGVTVHQWNDFHLFLAKLDTAVAQQAHEVVRSEALLEKARAAWRECEKTVKAYETLQSRHVEEQGKIEGRREQKLADEWSANLYHRDRSQH